MRKKLIVFIVITLIILLASAFVVWKVTMQPEPYSDNAAGCVDKRDEMIEGLGGSQKAAGNGISSTLEGCKK